MSRISIIVPVYKVEAYLDACAESLVGQTYRDLEIILVDDGSPDNCGRMCDGWAEKDSRIRVIHQENGGLSAARNSGIRAASGDYISLIDSDDWIDFDMMETMLGVLEKTGADIALCGWVNEYENEDREADEVLPGDRVLTRQEALARLAGEEAVPYIVAWNRLCRRSIYDGIEFPVGKIHEDEYTTHEILGAAKSVVTVNSAFYHYRHRAKSIMTTENAEESHLKTAEFSALRFDWFGANDAAVLQPACFKTFLSAYTMAVRDLDPANEAFKDRILAMSRKGQEMRKQLKDLKLSGKDELILKAPFMWRKLYALKGKLTGR